MADVLWSTVPAWEEMGSRELSYSRESGWGASVVLHCAGENVIALIADLIANRRPFPPMSAFTNAPIALSAPAVPLATDLQADTLEGEYVYDIPFAKVAVTYGADKGGADFVEESMEPNVEFVLLPYDRFNWTDNDGDPLLEAEAPGKQVHSCNFVRRFLQIDAIPAVLFDAEGCVNDADYTSVQLGRVFPEETLLLLPGSTTRKIKTDGTFTQDLTVKWAYKRDGWNKYWRTQSSDYESIYEKASASIYKSYPPVDMSDLLY